MHRTKLRYWAIRQFLHCVRLLATPGYTLSDLGNAFREDILRTFVRGHLNATAFIGMDDDHPELRTRMFMNIDRLERIAVEALDRLEKADPAKTGMLTGYVRAQKAHLAECVACRRYVCDTIIGDVVETAKLRDILKRGEGLF